MNGWQSILLAIATIVGAVLAARITGRATQKAAKTSADEDAFVRAKEIYESAINTQDERIEAIVADLELMKAELASAKESLKTYADRLDRTNTELRTSREEVSTLRRSVSQYEGRVIQLTEVLRLHNIDVPPWTLNPSDYGMLPGSIPDPGQPERTHET